MSNSSATRANYFNHECQNHTKCACRLLRFLPDFHFSICKMLFHLFLPGLCCMNNEAQCPSGVPPTPCSDSMLMTPERNTSQSRPSFRYCGKNLWQSRINIPSNLFRHLSNYRVECILKEQLADLIEPVWCQWVNYQWVNITRVEISKHTHPWDVGANYGHTSNSRVAVRLRKRGIFISPSAHIKSYPVALCPIISALLGEIQWLQDEIFQLIRRKLQQVFFTGF